MAHLFGEYSQPPWQPDFFSCIVIAAPAAVAAAAATVLSSTASDTVSDLRMWLSASRVLGGLRNSGGPGRRCAFNTTHTRTHAYAPGQLRDTAASAHAARTFRNLFAINNRPKHTISCWRNVITANASFGFAFIGQVFLGTRGQSGSSKSLPKDYLDCSSIFDSTVSSAAYFQDRRAEYTGNKNSALFCKKCKKINAKCPSIVDIPPCVLQIIRHDESIGVFTNRPNLNIHM